MNTKPAVVAVSSEAPLPKWRSFLRQNSEKINTLAENVVLPKNQRLIRQASRVGELPMEFVGTPDPHTSSVNIEPSALQESYNFPIFIVGISILQLILKFADDDTTMLLLFGYDPYRRHELWRYLTMVLPHSGYDHLLVILFLQLILGILLEIIHSWKRIAIIYLASVLGGSLFITVFETQVYIIGAGSAVSGLLFSHLATLIINWNEMDRKYCRVFSLLLFIAVKIGSVLYIELTTKEDSTVSYVNDIGGAAAGFLVSILVLKNFKEHPWEKKMQKICIGTLSAICVIGVTVNVTAWEHYYPTEWNVQYNDTFQKYLHNIN